MQHNMAKNHMKTSLHMVISCPQIATTADYTSAAALQDEVGAAGLTTVSNASFFGTTRFIGNEWGALQTK
jgi:hypothetical protein